MLSELAIRVRVSVVTTWHNSIQNRINEIYHYHILSNEKYYARYSIELLKCPNTELFNSVEELAYLVLAVVRT